MLLCSVPRDIKPLQRLTQGQAAGQGLGQPGIMEATVWYIAVNSCASHMICNAAANYTISFDEAVCGLLTVP